MTDSPTVKDPFIGVIYLPVLMFAWSADAQEDIQTFNLRHLECAPLSLTIAVEPEADELGLTQQAVRNATESRLRAARLMDLDSVSELLVTVEFIEVIGGFAFVMNVSLRHWVHFNMAEIFSVLAEGLIADPPLSSEAVTDLIGTAFESIEGGPVIVWRDEFIGTVGENAAAGQFILNGLNEALDSFIAAYLRMNEGTCL